jgi:hypothetical protein
LIIGDVLDARVKRAGERVDAQLSISNQRGFMSFRFPWAWGAADMLDWTLGLNPNIPMAFLTTGASPIMIALPSHAGCTAVKIEASATSLLIRVPAGVAAHIRTGRALTTTEVDLARFPMLAEGREYRSPGYATAANRADIQVEIAIGSVKIL